jgi:4-hydroxy-2-oxoheptanedioate aldolase
LFGAFGPGRPWPVVRAAKNDYHLINWLFDQGAAWRASPHDQFRRGGKARSASIEISSLGQRSFGPFRAARYGSRLDTYMPTADKAATLIVQLENLWAAEHIRDILAVQGIDAVFMGPNDLAYSMLQPGETLKADTGQWSAFARTPAVMEICANVMEECRAAGMPFGMTAGSMAEARDWIDRGASFATFGSDFSFMRAGAQHLCGADMERK